MNQFDRALQREILALALDSYPAYIGHAHTIIPSEFERLKNSPAKLILLNIQYLHDHKLINFDAEGYRSKGWEAINFVKATVHGIDFLLGDGGLTAILNVQTIKFHREAVVVLEDLIALSNMTSEEKEKAKSTLGELSLEALKVVVQTATTAGLAAITK